MTKGKLEDILLEFGGDCHDYYFGHSDNHHEARAAIKELVKGMVPDEKNYMKQPISAYGYSAGEYDGWNECRKAMLKAIEESL